MKLSLLLIPLLFLTSCMIGQNEGGKNAQGLTNTQGLVENPIPKNTESQVTSKIKDFGSGFILSQTDDETLLSYSGKTIKKWSHTPPKNVPFIWDEACRIVWNGFEKLSPENQSSGKQGVWDKLTEKEKKDCIKENLTRSISINHIYTRFIIIRRGYYETSDNFIFDNKNGKTHALPENIDNLSIKETNTGITVVIKNERGPVGGYELDYDTTFSTLISKKELPY